MKRKRVALYNPFLDTLGGGERYILSIMKALSEFDYESTIFWDENLTTAIEKRLHLTFQRLTFAPNIFKHHSVIKILTTLKDYDLFLYVTDGSYFASSAKKNIIYTMIPDKMLYKKNLINNLKLYNYRFISHSYFTQQILKKWGIQSEVLYPYLDDTFLNINIQTIKKEKIILSVGRFFKHLHTKRHDLMIKSFKSLRTALPQLKEYTLVLAGGFKHEDKEYMAELQTLIANDSSIIVKTNVGYDELVKLYKKASIYWHFAGYGIDDTAQPELVEHLGISPLEAMAAGCITMCYRAGGPKELIQDGENGFLFKSIEELESKMSTVLKDESIHHTIQTAAQFYTKNHFNYSIFKARVSELFL